MQYHIKSDCAAKRARMRVRAHCATPRPWRAARVQLVADKDDQEFQNFPPKCLKGFIPVGPRPTECVLHPRVNANNKLLANFAEKTLEDGTKPKMEIWVVNLGEAFNVRRR